MKPRNIWIALIVLSFGMLAGAPAWAQRVSLDALAQQVQSLVSRVTTLEAENKRLTNLLVHFSRNGDEIFITAANLHVVNGQNNTGARNGLGNVIIGYNESRVPFGSDDNRSGSHMLVVGSQLNYSGFGGIVAGTFNTTSGGFSTVTGGTFNLASGDFSSISGGTNNRATNLFSSVSGGQQNEASGFSSSVSGGQANIASGPDSNVSGGQRNIAGGKASAVSGGDNRKAEGQLNWAGGSFFSPQ